MKRHETENGRGRNNNNSNNNNKKEKEREREREREKEQQIQHEGPTKFGVVNGSVENGRARPLRLFGFLVFFFTFLVAFDDRRAVRNETEPHQSSITTDRASFAFFLFFLNSSRFFYCCASLYEFVPFFLNFTEFFFSCGP